MGVGVTLTATATAPIIETRMYEVVVANATAGTSENDTLLYRKRRDPITDLVIGTPEWFNLDSATPDTALTPAQVAALAVDTDLEAGLVQVSSADTKNHAPGGGIVTTDTPYPANTVAAIKFTILVGTADVVLDGVTYPLGTNMASLEWESPTGLLTLPFQLNNFAGGGQVLVQTIAPA